MKKLRDLKPGERVRLRGYSIGGTDLDGSYGVVIVAVSNLDIRVAVDGGGAQYLVKRSQCVPLRPKLVRWVNIYSGGVNKAIHETEALAHYSAQFDRTALVELREVRRIPCAGKAVKA